MTAARLSGLFADIFDDASMFPPAALKLADAAREHVDHRRAWYAGMVGPLVCNAGRLAAVEQQLARLGAAPADVAIVLTEGLDTLDAALAMASRCPSLRVRSVEVAIRPQLLSTALRRLGVLVSATRAACVEVPIARVTEHLVHELSAAGIRLKIRCGGTTLDAFRTEAELAVALVLCASERLAFKCTAGLHHAVRHRDHQSLFEHHGFLNIALAARTAAATASVAATTAVLSAQDGSALAAQAADLSAGDIAAIRAQFTCFGTCSIADPIADLLALGLVSAP